MVVLSIMDSPTKFMTYRLAQNSTLDNLETMDTSPINIVPGFGIKEMMVVAKIMGLVTIAIHVAFAIGVLRDILAIKPGDRQLVGPGVWVVATLLGGVFVAAIYWVMHRSQLRPQADAVSDEDQT